MPIGVKEGVLLPTPLKPTTARMIDVVAAVWTAAGFDPVITSGTDGVHMSLSLHYSGDALDFRIHGIEPLRLRTMAAKVRTRLGGDYDVVIEKDHLHVEYDPK